MNIVEKYSWKQYAMVNAQKISSSTILIASPAKKPSPSVQNVTQLLNVINVNKAALLYQNRIIPVDVLWEPLSTRVRDNAKNVPMTVEPAIIQDTVSLVQEFLTSDN